MAATIRSVTRAMQILELVAGEESGRTLKAIAERLKVNNTTVHNFLSTLVESGYLTQDRPRGPYLCGPGLLAFAERVRLHQHDLAQAAMPWMHSLQEHVDETLHLSVLVGREASDVLFMEGSQSIRFITMVGNRMPLHASAAGKILTAWKPENEVRRLFQEPLARYTPATQTDVEAAIAELGRIRERGYAVNLGEFDSGLRCIAGPIRNGRGEVIAALSMSAPAVRFPGDALHELQEIMRTHVDGISADLSGPAVAALLAAAEGAATNEGESGR